MKRQTSPDSTDCNRLPILGVPVDPVTMSQAIERLAALWEAPGLSVIVTPNSEIVVNAKKDPELMDILRRAELVIPDGIGLVYASKILGRPLTERVTGIDFLTMALAEMEKVGRSVYLLGSRPGTAEQAGVQLKKIFPGLTIAGTHHGYFQPEEEPALIEAINRTEADLLCVALGSPKQEKFMARHQAALTAKVAIGVGGSLDVFAGTLRRAPRFYREHGLEWLYRLFQEPSRYKRLAALPTFMLRVLTDKRKQAAAKTGDPE